MANSYKHGTYGEYAESVGAVPEKSKTIAVYVGTAPVNLISGYADKGLINKPLLVSDYMDAQVKLGYSADWSKFTLCEAIKAHFNNPLGNAGPVIFINVLDPAVHKKSTETTASVTFTNGSASIKSDTIILDTIGIEDKTLGVDYIVSYNVITGKAVITSIGATPISGTTEVTYDEVEPSQVDEDDIIGDATAAGIYTGLGCVNLINNTFDVVPSLIAAPSWSDHPDVYKAMLARAYKINGHWDAFVLADIPLTDAGSRIDTIALAKTWQTANGYTDPNSKVFFPQAKDSDNNIYHLSTLCVWRMVMTDISHDGIPMETPSNKPIPVAKQYFGTGSINVGFDQSQGNGLNEVGITTVVYWGGRWVLWGPHTAAYTFGSVGDNKHIFDNNVRMLQYVSNSFQSEHALTIDQPMTRAMSDTIRNREQQKADALAAVGAFIGKPTIEFHASDNTLGDLVEGEFVWSFAGTPTPPFKAGTLRVAYTTEGFSTFYEEA